ncbi:helix-hairpin-helix domain-containing protein [Mucilaginibacter panaciglaebae]|uniref:Competence ComEA-like helix-hairpin-helix protein n=1 Tax=Mucilaginibacter panaciglaebae TaxID=502331 RepID=A0ABP7WTX6_9SPHI
MKSRLKNYLSITKKEWNGMVILLFVIAAVLAAPYGYRYFQKDEAIDFRDFNKDVALLKRANGGRDIESGGPLSDTKIAKPVLYVFNPNNLPAQQWKQLGFSDKQIAIIKNYETRGGHFNSKEDVKKMYSITAADYQRIEPYIKIPDEGYISNKLAAGETIELNSADSAKLTRIHGIGPAFAQRIIEYRKRLGGFLNKEQLREVYGIDAEKYHDIQNQVTINPLIITKININRVDFEGLRKFPYLTNKQTNAVIQYRAQHGNYHSINDMKQIAILDEVILRKIEPYLSFK